MNRLYKHFDYYVYILECSDGTYYTGYTNDIYRRLGEHSTGRGAKYVKSRLPFKVAYLEGWDTRSEAMRREIAIKKLSHKEKKEMIERGIHG